MMQVEMTMSGKKTAILTVLFPYVKLPYQLWSPSHLAGRYSGGYTSFWYCGSVWV